jgi:hypothetical protein
MLVMGVIVCGDDGSAGACAQAGVARAAFKKWDQEVGGAKVKK